MFALNHTVTGVFIAAVIPQPAVALPLAFLAHFGLDALPHYGSKESKKSVFNHLKVILPIDMALAFMVLVAIAVWQPTHWPVLIAAGVLCASPDLMWFPKFWRSMHGDNLSRKDNWLTGFHRVIQWGERPWGVYVEIGWLAVITFALLAKTAI